MPRITKMAAGQDPFASAELITKSLVQDVTIALENEATMASGNAAVARMRGPKRYGARSFNAIQRALTMDLALTLARIFDEGGSDVASIPKLIRLLRDPTCKDEIRRQAAEWVPGLSDLNSEVAGRRIASAVEEYQALQSGARAELNALRAFRTDKLAHSLPDAPQKPVPRFQDLSRLLNAAASIIAHVQFAILDAEWEPSDTSEAVAHEADEFWKHALVDARSIPPSK